MRECVMLLVSVMLMLCGFGGSFAGASETEVPTMVHLAGTPEQIGSVWGEMNRDIIVSDMDSRYLKRAADEGISEETLIKRSAEYVQFAERYAPHWLEEERAIARAAGVDEDLYTAFYDSQVRGRFLVECTSYSVSRGHADDGAIMFHKTRDSTARPQSAARVESSLEGINSFILVTDATKIRPSMMVNDKGLAGANDYPADRKSQSSTLDLPPAEPRYRGVMAAAILRYIAERASSSAEALVIIEDFVESGYYAGGDVGGSHWLFVDREGVILEVCNNSEHVVSKFHTQDVYFSRFKKSAPVRRLREADAVDFEMFRSVARQRPILTGQSISGMTVEIDPNRPDLFTCAWVSLPTRAAAFPVLTGQRRTPRVLLDGTAYELGENSPRRISQWEELEKSMHTEKERLIEKVAESVAGADPEPAHIEKLETWSNSQAERIIKTLQPAFESVRISPLVSEQLGGAEAVTASAWVARDDTGKGRRNDILQVPIRGTSIKIGMMITGDNKFRASGRTAGGEDVQGVNTLKSWDADRMRHAAAVYDPANDEIRVYIDGVRQETTGHVEWEKNVFSADAGDSGAIGMAARGEHHFEGRIKDVRIYDRALDEEEIRSIREAEGTDEPGEGLVGRWLHDDAEAVKKARPTSRAQENALKRIAQLTAIQWQPVLEDTMPSRTGFFSGEPVTGVPYSSARYPGHRIGYDISLETFMTAVQNPKSVLYTENLSKDPYNVPNSATYYGLACSSLAQYASRDDFSVGTSRVHDNPESANVTLIEEQSADGVELLALLNTIGGGHQEIVTDITYSDGEVASIELTDIVYQGTRRRTYTPREFNKYLDDRKYLIYRHDVPEDISYTPSQYVAVGDEEPREVTYNDVLALDRGNKANYVKDAPVKFNVMDEDADLLVIKKDGATFDTVDITESGVMEKTYSDCGEYSAHCVMKDQTVSDPVEFIVAYVEINVPDEAEMDGDITITFSAEECKPRYIMMQGKGGRSLTEQEIGEGSITVSHDTTGSFYVLLNAVNEFGGVWSNKEDIEIMEE